MQKGTGLYSTWTRREFRLDGATLSSPGGPQIDLRNFIVERFSAEQLLFRLTATLPGTSHADDVVLRGLRPTDVSQWTSVRSSS
jgi:hypothetical protein